MFKSLYKLINLQAKYMNYTYETNCTASTAELINNMVDNSKPTNYKELVEEVGQEQLAELFSCYDWSERGDLKMRDDNYVFYYKSEYNNKPCYYIQHSAIEYIFTAQ